MANDPEWSDFLKNLLRVDISQEESQECYRQLHESYDKLFDNRPENYSPFKVLSLTFKELFPHTSDVHVLDVGAGSGLTGQMLLDLGCTKIDAVEPQPDLARIAKNKNIYEKMFIQFIDGDDHLHVSDDAYDSIICAGAFGPGHIKCKSLHEMIRVVKPGGFVIVCMREEYLQTVPEYKDRLKPLMDKLVDEGKWRQRKWITYPNHYMGKSGLIWVYQVC